MFHDVSLSAFVKFVIFALASRWASPRDAKAWQKLLQFDVKTSCRQANDLFEVMQQPSAPSGEWYWRILLENIVFSPPRTCLTPHSGAERPAIANVTYTSLKSAFNGLRLRRWQYGSIFIRLAVIASETQKMSRHSKRIGPCNSSRLSKVIDLGVNGKPICDFLLVINCNWSRICYRFRDIQA